jgi:glyoxylase-like metal-dependent hydrolase (beta-lactamase superfamily II)/8-oxo-dGTP pyrophosphatase MutT (NUDIX family)
MSETSLYELVLTQLGEGAELPRPRPPRGSAAVVLWRRNEAGEVEVFWMRRADALPFMGGWHAFPGGGLSRSDATLHTKGEPRGVELPEASMPPAVVGDIELEHRLEPGIAACALRELFEETGVLVAETESPEELRPLAAALEARLADGDRFGHALDAEGVTLDLEQLVYAGRWLTPPLGPMRFDTRFFLLEWQADRTPQPRAASSESAEVEWVRPADALDRWRRGEVIAAPPILHLLRVLAEEGPEEGIERLLDPVESNLGPHRQIEFQPGVILFPLRTPTLPPAAYTNAYVLGFGEAVLVDPGSPFDHEIDALLEAIAALSARGREVGAIWLTHHHPDHVGGVERARRELDVPVLAHPLTAERLRPRGIEIDATLEDGQRVVLGGEPELPLRVVHTPGHARGHLAFFDERAGSLVVGDMIAGIGTIVVDPPEGNMDDYLGSLRKLIELEPRTLFPSHGPTIRTAVAKLEEYVEHRLWREERVVEAWNEGLREPGELLPRVYDDVPEIARPLARRQLFAHLERLSRLGRLLGDRP